jgi:hypothetical protein
MDKKLKAEKKKIGKDFDKLIKEDKKHDKMCDKSMMKKKKK